MMGHEPEQQKKLFHYNLDLDRRVRPDHVLRKIDAAVDFSFIYEEVGHTYGDRGNVSVPPPVLLKMMLLLVLYNVRSERELVATIPERLDWLWFLGMDLEDSAPDHSVLSKARRRWGPDAFRRFFERVVSACVQAGLVDGGKLFTDSCLVDANASQNSLVDTHSLARHLNKSYKKLEARLEEAPAHSKSGPVNQRYVSTTDPDAAINRSKNGTKLRYKVHRGVDEKAEVITATRVTASSVDDARCLEALVDEHGKNTGSAAETVVADTKYGTTKNFLACHDRGVAAHIPPLAATQQGTGHRRGIFPASEFTYDAASDVFICPAGKRLARRRRLHSDLEHYEYAAPKVACASCELKKRCTRSATGRTVKRHLRQEELDRMLARATGSRAKKDLKTRQHLMERSFARGTRYGIKRARWRGLWRVEIQEYLMAAVQNLLVLAGPRPKQAGAAERRGGNHANGRLRNAIAAFWGPLDAIRQLCRGGRRNLFLPFEPAPALP